MPNKIELLDHAVEVLRRGDALTLDAVAREAGVTKPGVVHHFGTKDGLWHETVREAVSWYRDRVFDPVDGSSAGERLRWYFREYIRFSAHHPDFFRMMTQENTLRSERLEWLVETHVGATVTRTIAMIEAAQQEGAFIAGDPMQLLYLFLGAATSPYRSSAEIMLLTGRSPEEPAQVEAHVLACERLFFRDPPAPQIR